MYDFLRGRLVESNPGRIVIEVGGIGFDVNTIDYDSESFGAKGQEVLLWTHLHFKEDRPSLFGFVRRQERELFRLLIKVNGVGPRLAMQILSGIKPEELIRALTDEDWKRLTLISGIGPKTARRLLIQLKEKLTDQELQFIPSGHVPKDPLLSQAYNALLNLGFPPETVRTALKDLPASGQLEDIVKSALVKLAP